MICQLFPHVLLTPTNFCFHDQVITSLPGVLGNKWSPLNICIYLYWNELRNAGLSFPTPGYSQKYETNICFFLYLIPGKAYGLRHIDGKARTCLVMSPYLIKAMRKFYGVNNIIYQKYEPTQSSIYSSVCYQFDINFYEGSIDEESTEDREKKNFDLLQLIITEIMRILLAVTYFPTYSEICWQYFRIKCNTGWLQYFISNVCNAHNWHSQIESRFLLFLTNIL